MFVFRSHTARISREESGFTLVEMLATIVILGVLTAIAIIILLGILEQRRVDAATRQLVSDFRLAHVSATTQLTDWRVAYTPGSPDYHLMRLLEPCSTSCATPEVSRTVSKALPRGTMVKAATNLRPGEAEALVEFNSDGTERAFYGVSTTVTVSSEDGNPSRRIGLTAATSRIRVDW